MKKLLPVALWCMRAVYAVLKLIPAGNLYVLMTRLYDTTSYDFSRFADELRALPGSPRVVILNHKEHGKLRTFGQIAAQTWYLSRAKGCIVDSYMVPVSVLRHRRSLTIVQAWHALGAIKRFGYAALGSAEGRDPEVARLLRMHEGYTWVIAGGTRMAGPYHEAFHVSPDRVLPYGSPKVDFLVSLTERERTRGKLYARYPQLAERPTILYAPTFHQEAPLPIDELVAAVDPERYNLVVKLHPLDRLKVKLPVHVIEDPEVETIEWLHVAGTLISDYSAVVFEAAAARVPTALWTFDLADYRHQRGLFLDLETQAPGPVSTDIDEIMRAIDLGGFDPARQAAFRDAYVQETDGHCTARIVQLAAGRQPDEID